MCQRCNAVDEFGKSLKPSVTRECSWCDGLYDVCGHAAWLIRTGGKAGLCKEHMAVLMGKRIGDFGQTYKNRPDQERDVDANGWLSNAIRLLEDPVER